MKTLLLVATEAEKPRRSVPAGSLTIIVTGIGKVNACRAVMAACSRETFSRAVNLGICGSLRPAMPLFGIYQIRQVLEGDREPIGQVDIPSLDLPAIPGVPFACATLVTQDHSVKTTREGRRLRSLGADLVDMEAFGAAMAAATLKLPFYSMKIVSDHTQRHASALICKNIGVASRKLWEQVRPWLMTPGD